MARKRKRAGHSSVKNPASDVCQGNRPPQLLFRYYPRVDSLRSYLVSLSSKVQKRKIGFFGLRPSDLSGDASALERKKDLIRLLDTTFVGIPGNIAKAPEVLYLRGTVSLASQAELVDHAIRCLFRSKRQNLARPQHLLCHGYHRAPSSSEKGALPVVESQYPNNNVSIIKGRLWNDLLAVMGPERDTIMLTMILECGIFVAVESGHANLLQLSGIPITELPVLGESTDVSSNSFGKILFVRSRMLYGRAVLDRKGKVQLGLGNFHALNRFVDPKDLSHTCALLQYIFPRQFGHHNVFTSQVDKSETMQQFADYTVRENVTLGGGGVKISRRLRGLPFELVQTLQRLHLGCEYEHLLNHYCPVRSTAIDRGIQGPDLNVQEESMEPGLKDPTVAHATPTARVSAFCRAVLLHLIPNQFWDPADGTGSNRKRIFKKIDHFIRLRRFENTTLHDVMDGLAIQSVPWLALPESPAVSMSRTDFCKRVELLAELVYYVFDSILIPLIRSNFHVTESGSHRNRLFYFRQDVWRSLTDSHLKHLRTYMFQELKPEMAAKMLQNRTLGYSRIRLRPKTNGVRPIMNLRRRPMVKRGNRRVLGQSINSALAGVHGVLKYEKVAHPERLKASIFSVGDLYSRLRDFKADLAGHGLDGQKLYFAKVDVRACFDSIPQEGLLLHLQRILQEPEYSLEKYAQVKLSDARDYDGTGQESTKLSRRFNMTAKPTDDFTTFDQAVEQDLASGKNNTIFVDMPSHKVVDQESIGTLLQDHIKEHTVKIGRTYYRQKRGIPQGSVLSAHLCSLFYGQLESERLGFLAKPGNLLLRLIDDFLLITTDLSQARRFLDTMHNGIEEFGVEVDLKKSMVNFNVTIKAAKIATSDGSLFPYCGNLINTTTLELVKDRGRLHDHGIGDSLTVDVTRVPGRSFYRKTLNTLKIQAQAMLLDTAFNTRETVMCNMYEMFVECGMKFHCHVKSLPASRKLSSKLLIRTVQDLIRLGQALIKSKSRYKDFACSVSDIEVKWLGIAAFLMVLRRKQKVYMTLISWMESALSLLRLDAGVDKTMTRIVKSGQAAFSNVQY